MYVMSADLTTVGTDQGSVRNQSWLNLTLQLKKSDKLNVLETDRFMTTLHQARRETE